MLLMDQMTPKRDLELAKKIERYRGVREIAKKMKDRIDGNKRGIDMEIHDTWVDTEIEVGEIGELIRR